MLKTRKNVLTPILEMSKQIVSLYFSTKVLKISIRKQGLHLVQQIPIKIKCRTN